MGEWKRKAEKRERMIGRIEGVEREEVNVKGEESGFGRRDGGSGRGEKRRERDRKIKKILRGTSMWLQKLMEIDTGESP